MYHHAWLVCVTMLGLFMSIKLEKGGFPTVIKMIIHLVFHNNNKRYSLRFLFSLIGRIYKLFKLKHQQMLHFKRCFHIKSTELQTNHLCDTLKNMPLQVHSNCQLQVVTVGWGMSGLVKRTPVPAHSCSLRRLLSLYQYMLLCPLPILIWSSLKLSTTNQPYLPQQI